MYSMRTFLFIGIFLSIVTINFPAHSQTKQYPKSFLWGAAFSAHQTEGVTGGGENGDWYQFEHPATENSPIANGDNADLSIDHWNRYEDDLQAAKSTGLNTIRISLSWEKIEPQPGIFNSEVMAHYKTVLKRMRELGLRPMISLHHFTHPIWFNQNGGWLSAQSPEYFARYAQYVAQNLSDVCGLWMTFNDPMGFIHLAYVNGEIPPHKKGLSNGFEAAFNTVRAHRLAVYAFHKARSTNNVGVAYGFKLFDPFDLKNEQDVRAAKELSEISNWAWLRATETGHLEFRYTQPGIIWDKQIIFQRNILTSEMILHAKIDWLGVNFYDHSLVRGTTKPIPFELINTQGLEGDNGSTLAPQALEKITRLVAKHFNYPLIITESGLADSDDSRRPDFIRRNLYALDRLRNGSELGDPIDVRGYYHWSLMDSFEWLNGYKYRFGLFEIQYGNNLKRVPRYSAQVYLEEITKRSPPRY